EPQVRLISDVKVDVLPGIRSTRFPDRSIDAVLAEVTRGGATAAGAEGDASQSSYNRSRAGGFFPPCARTHRGDSPIALITVRPFHGLVRHSDYRPLPSQARHFHVMKSGPNSHPVPLHAPHDGKWIPHLEHLKTVPCANDSTHSGLCSRHGT